MSRHVTTLACKSEDIFVLDLFANANQCARSEVMRYALGFMIKHHPATKLGQDLRRALKLTLANYAHKKKMGESSED